MIFFELEENLSFFCSTFMVCKSIRFLSKVFTGSFDDMWHGKASNPSLQMQLRKALQQHDEELTRLRAQTNVLETKEGFLWIFGAPGGWKCRQSLWWHCKSAQPSFSQTWNHFFGRDWIDLDWDVGCKCEIHKKQSAFIKTVRQQALPGREDSERNVQMGILLENAPEHEKRVDDSVFQSRTELFRRISGFIATWIPWASHSKSLTNFQQRSKWLSVGDLAGWLRCQEVDKKCQKHAEMLASLEAT